MIIAGLGSRKLGQLTVTECDDFLIAVASGEFGRRPVNRDGVARTRRMLIKAINNEMRTGNLSRNVADLSVMPIFAERQPIPTTDEEDGEDIEGNRRSLTYDELMHFRLAARQPYRLVVELIGRNGLRPSEARALRWKCIDLDELTLTVNRQMSSNDRLTRTKTKRARRTIPIDNQTAECLDDWRQRQSRSQDRYKEQWRDAVGLVVTTRVGTTINRNNLKRSITRISARADIDPIVPYELRHTAITLQLDAGHDVRRVADWAGTSERMIEEIYRHRLTRVAELGPVRSSRRPGA